MLSRAAPTGQSRAGPCSRAAPRTCSVSRMHAGRWWAAIAIVLGGCGESIAIDDGGRDAPRCEAPEPFATGSPDGHVAPLSAGPGEARAGRVGAGDLPTDPSG